VTNATYLATILADVYGAVLILAWPMCSENIENDISFCDRCDNILDYIVWSMQTCTAKKTG